MIFSSSITISVIYPAFTLRSLMPVKLVCTHLVFDDDFEDRFEDRFEDSSEDSSEGSCEDSCKDLSEDDFEEALPIKTPINLNDSSDFPPLTTAATADGWDYIESQETDDVLVTEDTEDWEQLELAKRQSLAFEYCFATIAKQTQHVPSPTPRLAASTVLRDTPLVRRKKNQQDDDDDSESLWDLYPVDNSDKQFQKAHARRRKELLHCFNTIPTPVPEEPVVTHPRLHQTCAYSEPLTDHQYQHAIFKHVQWDKRWMGWGKYYEQPDLRLQVAGRDDEDSR
ncbi:hypothetical protein K450DRAFT_255550 [Umbelopsis ramanniana AG]|uniref:Uncharacterized protein n=1 Tax=Umbelopsis ramanniana AG TaxID=1314678 RepID=A0AAD5E3N9_UMBRA|nr:uncharacterized protein K450DRAFT_255550 [Umbelopsis ramanniana AG]KAI8576771.1 hypothetical protein K450DRAFT_255550 [Umbelopsis ramanniana AG]